MQNVSDDSSSSVRLNWMAIIPTILVIVMLIFALVWAIQLAHEDFTKNIIFIILFLILIGLSIHRLVKFRYIQTDDKKIDLKKELKSKIKQKIKDEVTSKEFRIGLVIETVSLFAIFALIGLQEQISSDFILDTLNQIAVVLVIFFLPGYMTFRKLKRDKIRNKINIIFFCYTFMTIGLVISAMALQTYQESIPSVIFNFPSIILPDVDLSLLGFYLWILPFKVVFAKYSLRFVVYFAILGSKPGITTDDDKYPY